MAHHQPIPEPDDDELLTHASLSQLSSTLLSHGYLSSPLVLTSLFLHPTTPLSPSTLSSHQSLLRQEHKAREQVSKCLWNMLSRFQDSASALERVSTKLGIVEFELERERAKSGREERERKRIEKELEGERARTKECRGELEKEVESGKRVREEFNKVRLNLQLVKNQAVQDGRRKEQEFIALQSRFNKVTSGGGDGGGLSNGNGSTTVLNYIAQPHSTSTFGASTHRSRNSPPLQQQHQTATIAVTGSDFLEEALRNCDEERGRLEDENKEMRSTLSEVDEWCEHVGELRGIGHSSHSSEPSLLNHFQHASPSTFGDTLHPKLHHIRVQLLSAIETNESDILRVRDEMGEILEVERTKVAEERRRREDLEKELEEAKEVILRSEEIAKGITEAKMNELADEEAEEEDEEETEEARSTKLASALQHAKNLALSKLEEEKKFKKRQESQRAKSVQAFLGELGDSPVATTSTLPFNATSKLSRPTASTSSSTSQISKPKSSSSSTSTTTIATKKSPSLSPPLSTHSSELPSPFLSSQPQLPKPLSSRNGLANLLAAGASPPSTTSTSTSVLVPNKVVEKEKEKVVEKGKVVVNPILAAAKEKARRDKERKLVGGGAGEKENGMRGRG